MSSTDESGDESEVVHGRSSSPNHSASNSSDSGSSSSSSSGGEEEESKTLKDSGNKRQSRPGRRRRKRRRSSSPSQFQSETEEDYSASPSVKRSRKKKSRPSRSQSPRSRRRRSTATSSSSEKKCAATHCAIKENAPLLELLVRANDEERNCLLQHIDDDALDIVCCCIFNAIWNKELVPRDRRQLIKNRLGTFRQPLVYLSRHRNNNRGKRRKLLIQHGAGLPLLLSSVLPAIKASTLDVIAESRDIAKKRGRNRKVVIKEDVIKDNPPPSPQ